MTEQELILFITTTQPKPELADVIAKVDFAEPVGNIETLCVSMGIATKREFQKAHRSAQRAHNIRGELGCVPATTAEFVHALLDATNFTLRATDAQPLTWVSPVSQRRTRLDAYEFLTFAYDRNRNLLGNQFQKADIADECEFLNQNLSQAVLDAVLAKLTDKTALPFDWHKLVATVFDTRTIPADLTIAVLQKFIWQVKRRLAGEPVTYHLMPVLYGSQGCGKSVFIGRMLGELGSLFTATDFNRLSDNREANLFKHYALFLDEMNKADRADMDAVKAVITREELSYRPMGTNQSVTVTQNASFIGASNKLLEQLINDHTGNRRFFQLDYNSASGPAEFAFVNSLDFAAMWCSVDHLAADPTEPFRDEMRAFQSRHSNRSSVGEFVDSLVENEGRYRAPTIYAGEAHMRTLPTGIMTKDELFLAYRDWCAAMRKAKPLEQQSFLAEVRRMAAQEPAFPIHAKRTNKLNGWTYTGPVAEATAVMMKIAGKAVM